MTSAWLAQWKKIIIAKWIFKVEKDMKDGPNKLKSHIVTRGFYSNKE